MAEVSRVTAAAAAAAATVVVKGSRVAPIATAAAAATAAPAATAVVVETALVAPSLRGPTGVRVGIARVWGLVPTPASTRPLVLEAPWGASANQPWILLVAPVAVVMFPFLPQRGRPGALIGPGPACAWPAVAAPSADVRAWSVPVQAKGRDTTRWREDPRGGDVREDVARIHVGTLGERIACGPGDPCAKVLRLTRPRPSGAGSAAAATAAALAGGSSIVATTNITPLSAHRPLAVTSRISYVASPQGSLAVPAVVVNPVAALDTRPARPAEAATEAGVASVAPVAPAAASRHGPRAAEAAVVAAASVASGVSSHGRALAVVTPVAPVPSSHERPLAVAVGIAHVPALTPTTATATATAAAAAAEAAAALAAVVAATAAASAPSGWCPVVLTSGAPSETQGGAATRRLAHARGGRARHVIPTILVRAIRPRIRRRAHWQRDAGGAARGGATERETIA